ncbi:hypothetical protein D9V37_06795 [Nocardioides mangrovicus]|uniref:Uncharacterized protein n=1 Tax=Nocardioides mangrovicus TaxID=2478913 RepID=A0A3L8P3M5_9ACTN|nr:hypothetical protein [Nocardioides mangrovicus]RLV49622.1 hypothetical protein D9V37_06795 [Nocardioides mangrovicus]
MTASLRWLLVALVAVAVAAPPTVLRLWPASGSGLSAAQVADRVRAAEKLGWSGEVHTVGSLKVPGTAGFANLSSLAGGTSDLRVWWRSATSWRVDRTRSSGESDLARDDDRVVRWTYESRRAVTTSYSPVRLPDESDLLPPTLAARALSGARDDELTRLAPQRIAGHSAVGLRLVPDQAGTTISHVDLWADEASGLPLRVAVYAAGSRVPVLTTQASSVHLGAPSASTTRFDFPSGVKVHTSYAIDDAAGANAFAPFTMPSSLAGMKRRGDPADFGAVGIYGRGLTDVLVIPLRHQVAHELYDQLAQSPAATTTRSRTEARLTLRLGPLSVALVFDRTGHFLLAGTVTPQKLLTAVPELREGVGVERR